MTDTRKRARLGCLLAMALGAVALLALPGLASAKDRNHDRIPDRWEKRHRLSLKVDQARRDQDGDSLGNRGEFQAGDNPRDRDSDGDGVMDGAENAGTIASYDTETGRLTINLYGGDTISGIVTDQTRVDCGCNHQGDENESGDVASRPGPGSGDPSAEGPGPADEGDDSSGHGPGPASGPPGQGDDENDDPPGHDGTPPGASEGPGRGAEHASMCSTTDLVAGAVVKAAELELEHGTATFSRIGLEPSGG